jgi:alkanesulfonate monooxygenase SsuD/methylene tetrahydromethanopterin reductase-like flavin-dependent oxidoreductase (luciferase family)
MTTSASVARDGRATPRDRSMVQVGAQYMGGDFSVKTFGVAAESVGFDSVWCGDHMAHYVDGIASLGVLAGCTERVTIGSNVIVVPFRPAVVTAKGLLTAASVAEGRTIFGLGAGGEFPVEFQATGTDPRTRGRFMDEALEVMRLAWSGEPVTFHGRWTIVDDLVMEPRLAVAPPIWIGGRSDAALQRAARVATGYVPYLVSPEQLASRLTKIRAAAAEIGRDLTSFTAACLVFFVPGRNREAAARTALEMTTLQGMTRERIESFFVLGNDDDVLGRLQEYVNAGARHVILGCAPGNTGQFDAYMEAAARVLPLARGLVPAVHPRDSVAIDSGLTRA